jgi:hypothetical protein
MDREHALANIAQARALIRELQARPGARAEGCMREAWRGVLRPLPSTRGCDSRDIWRGQADARRVHSTSGAMYAAI